MNQELLEERIRVLQDNINQHQNNLNILTSNLALLNGHLGEARHWLAQLLAPVKDESGSDCNAIEEGIEQENNPE